MQLKDITLYFFLTNMSFKKNPIINSIKITKKIIVFVSMIFWILREAYFLKVHTTQISTYNVALFKTYHVELHIACSSANFLWTFKPSFH